MSDPAVVKDKSAIPFMWGWSAWIEETGTELRGHVWQYLKQVVGKHLDKHKLNVGDREVYLHKAVCMALAKAGKAGMCIRPYKVSASSTAMIAYDKDPRMPANIRRGQYGYDARAWGVWHMAAWDGKLNDALAKDLLNRIGCGACRSHATRYIMGHPLPSDPQGAFRMTVDMHNNVNVKLGRKVVGYDEAQKFWNLT